jgi:hypothetical protein
LKKKEGNSRLSIKEGGQFDMQDKELYRQLLGLKEPWKVTEVKVDIEGQKVEVYIQWP